MSSMDPGTLALPDREWLYHVTTVNTARLIQGSGMSSALARTGVAKAVDGGAFDQDRKKNMPGKVMERLRKYAQILHAHGYSADAAARLESYLPSLSFATSRDTGRDRANLDAAETSYIERFVEKLKTEAKPDVTPQKLPIKSPIVVSSAERLLQSYGEHGLVRLAERWAEVYYLIEESVTASHIYFTVPEYAGDAYREYARIVGAAQAVVLRVKRTLFKEESPPQDADGRPLLVQDMSEYRAKRTEATVPATHIEIMYPSERFVEEQHRCNPGNWMPLPAWTLPAPASEPDAMSM